MSTPIRQKFVLIGPLAGRTINLGSRPYRFVNGETEMTGPPEEIGLHARFLERNWQAYPENHDAVKEFYNGQRNLPADPEPDANKDVSSGVQPDGQGDPAGAAVDGGSDDGDSARGTGGVAQGDGLGAPEVNERLRRAIYSLDPSDDNHWTKDGKPAMTAVEKAYGAADVTRADVDAAAPGYDREEAQSDEGEKGQEGQEGL